MKEAKQLAEFENLFSNRVIEAFGAGVQQVLELMANSNVERLAPYLESRFVAKGDVAGCIGLVSHNLRGVMSVTFEKGCILGLLRDITGQSFEEVNEHAADAVGELTNLIYGSAKRILNANGHQFAIALPMVVVGNVRIRSIHKGLTLVVPFSNPDGKLYVELTVEK